MVRQGRVPLENVIYGISSNIYVKKNTNEICKLNVRRKERFIIPYIY